MIRKPFSAVMKTYPIAQVTCHSCDNWFYAACGKDAAYVICIYCRKKTTMDQVEIDHGPS